MRTCVALLLIAAIVLGTAIAVSAQRSEPTIVPAVADTITPGAGPARELINLPGLLDGIYALQSSHTPLAERQKRHVGVQLQKLYKDVVRMRTIENHMRGVLGTEQLHFVARLQKSGGTAMLASEERQKTPRVTNVVEFLQQRAK